MTDLVRYERALQERLPIFAQVLRPDLPPERLMRTVLISLERVPELLNCDQQSVMNAAMSAAVLGVEPDGVTGQSFILPFKKKAQLIIGYRGYTTLAARAGMTVAGNVVREGDHFDFMLGSEPFVIHKPKLGNTGPIIGAWATGMSRDRPPIVAVLDRDELDATRKRSPGAKRSESPWNDPAIGFPAMCSKTAKRRLARDMPLMDYQRAAAMEEATERGKPAWLRPDGNLVVEGEAEAVSPLPQREMLDSPDAIIEAPWQHPDILALKPRAQEAARTALEVIGQANSTQSVFAAIDRFRQLRDWLRDHEPAASAVVERAFAAAYREHVDPDYEGTGA